jgi:hypothetical protein
MLVRSAGRLKGPQRQSGHAERCTALCGARYSRVHTV